MPSRNSLQLQLPVMNVGPISPLSLHHCVYPTIERITEGYIVCVSLMLNAFKYVLNVGPACIVKNQ